MRPAVLVAALVAAAGVAIYVGTRDKGTEEPLAAPSARESSVDTRKLTAAPVPPDRPALAEAAQPESDGEADTVESSADPAAPSPPGTSEEVPEISAADLANTTGAPTLTAPDVEKHDPYDVIDATDEERSKMKVYDAELNSAIRSAKGGTEVTRAVFEYQQKAIEVLGEDRAEMLLRVMEQQGKDLVEAGTSADPFLVQ
jgi:hypothetical protein